jgi:hypothetical protein
VHPSDFSDEKFIDVSTGPGQHYIFAIEKTTEVPPRTVGFSLLQRKWATLSINQVNCNQYKIVYLMIFKTKIIVLGH